MNITIENKDNVFTVKGEICLTNAKILKRYMRSQFLCHEYVVLNINEVEKIDRTGINILTGLYQTSLAIGKSFSIVGYGCKDLYDEILMSA